jgi:hypothetical protein
VRALGCPASGASASKNKAPAKNRESVMAFPFAILRLDCEY